MRSRTVDFGFRGIGVKEQGPGATRIVGVVEMERPRMGVIETVLLRDHAGGEETEICPSLELFHPAGLMDPGRRSRMYGIEVTSVIVFYSSYCNHHACLCCEGRPSCLTGTCAT